jgi:choline dehydrogenase-like flavoprotein
MLVGLFRPASRGRLSLTVADRHAKLHIDPRYFAEPVDPEALCEGARQSMELASIRALDPWRGGSGKPCRPIVGVRSILSVARPDHTGTRWAHA